MKSEYLIFNILIIIGPLCLSFEKNIFYFKKWKTTFQAIIIPLILFVVWDALVTGRHWWFNEKYTLGVRIINLPIEEWLFFITIPFSSLFVWEVLAFHLKNKRIDRLDWLNKALLLFIPIGMIIFGGSKEYTGLVLIAIGFAGFLDKILKTNIFQQTRIYQFLIIIIGLILLFNGYLTWRPVVLYDEGFQLGIRILTIPVEDFFYGVSYLLLCTIFYEKIKGSKIG